MTGPGKYMKEVVREGKRVRWPKKDELFPKIAVVIIIAVVVALFLALEDLVAYRLIDQLTDAFGGK